MMTRQDFQAAADVLRENQVHTWGPAEEQRFRIADGLADMFAASNPRFDRARFMAAANVPADPDDR